MSILVCVRMHIKLSLKYSVLFYDETENPASVRGYSVFAEKYAEFYVRRNDFEVFLTGGRIFNIMMFNAVALSV